MLTHSTDQTATLPVVVVGAGPVGLMAAYLLTRFGVPVQIYDRNTEPTTEWRAPGIHARTLEMLARYELIDDFMAAGFMLTQMSMMWQGNARKISDMGRGRSEFPSAMCCAQTETERILREHLQTLGVNVQWGHTFTGYSVQAVGSDVSVDVAFQLVDSDKRHSVRAAYLIGCDGGGSRVRKAIGASFDGQMLGRNMAVCDVVMEHSLPIPAGFIMDHQGLMGAFQVAKCKYRMFAEWKDEIEGPLTSDRFLALVRERVAPFDIGDDTRILSTSRFELHERRASRYESVDGRVFLCGDAAHVHSPAGGQGMNTGLQDAENLAWKLALVYHGTGNTRLLSSYGTERIPIADQIIALSNSLTMSFRRPYLIYSLARLLPLLRFLPAWMVRPRLERTMQLRIHYVPDVDTVTVTRDTEAWRRASGMQWWRPSNWFGERLCQPGMRAYDGLVEDVSGGGQSAQRLRHWHAEHVGRYTALVFVNVTLLGTRATENQAVDGSQQPLLQDKPLDELHRQLGAVMEVLRAYSVDIPVAFLLYRRASKFTPVDKQHPVIAHLRKQYSQARVFLDVNQGENYDHLGLAGLYGCTHLRCQHAVYLIRPDVYVATRSTLDEAANTLRAHLATIIERQAE